MHPTQKPAKYQGQDSLPKKVYVKKSASPEENTEKREKAC